MSLSIRKTFACLLVALSLFGIVGAAFGGDYYPTSFLLDFQNYCYLGFNQAMNFTDAPHRGASYDSSLVGYWSMDEDTGTVAHDGSSNGNNGTIKDAIWTTGQYGNALAFDGHGSDVTLASIPSISTYYSVSIWFKPNELNRIQSLVSLRGSNSYPVIYLFNNNRLLLYCGDSKYLYSSKTFTSDDLNKWWHVVVVLNGTSSANWKLYINGSDNTGVHPDSGTYYEPSSSGSIGSNHGGAYFNGVIDDVRIYNRALSATEVATLYVTDPVSFANYYSCSDPVTNNTMMVHVDNPIANSSNVTLVTCTNFFIGNRLVFQANNSATVNVWTNLGQPAFTSGVWNSQNYTTTLTLDASSTAELNWNTYNITTYVDAHSGVSPSNVTVGYGGSQTLSFNASQGYRFNVSVDGVSQGQISSYTFNDITAPHTVNVVSTPLTYTITASADAHSTITPGNVSVNYGGSQQFNVTADSGYYISHVYVDGTDQGNLTTYNFTNVQDNHTISVTSATLAPTNTPTPTASASPAPSQTPQPTTSPFPTETAVIAVIAVATLIAVFALAFKKGYITIEVVDEENPQENQDDYTI
jgi:hypothetical protein